MDVLHHFECPNMKITTKHFFMRKQKRTNERPISLGYHMKIPRYVCLLIGYEEDVAKR